MSLKIMFASSIKTKPQLLINNGLDSFSMIFLGGGACLVFISLILKYLHNATYPTIVAGSEKYLLEVGFALMSAYLIWTIWSSNRYFLANQFRDTSKDSTVLQTMGAIATYFMIELGIILIKNAFAVQSIAVDVALYYTSGAIFEEIIYRGCLMLVVQTVVVKLIQPKLDKKYWIYLINFISAIIGGVVFAAVHKQYAGSILIVFTFLGGFAQCCWYLYSKNLFVVMLAHIFINLLAVATLLAIL